MHEAELEDRLAALMLRVDRHEDTTAADRRSLTRALADSVQREQAYSEQIAHLRKLVEQLDLGMKMERESRLRADARAMALERRVEELERRQHTSASRVMPRFCQIFGSAYLAGSRRARGRGDPELLRG